MGEVADGIFRTPDSAFEGPPDFPYAPRYWMHEGLRTHYVDEGPRDAPVALLVHGQPTWSYLYRKMIPGLLAAGYRVVAPDHIGFGRSDKVLDEGWYTLDRHVDRFAALLAELDLRRVTLACQDWGGPIGLVSATDAPERFERLVILNTWLHRPDYPYSDAIRAWRNSATDRLWLGWTGGDLPTGAIVERALAVRAADPVLARRPYDAPFPGGGVAKAGARRFPAMIPFADPAAGGAERQARAAAALSAWAPPCHFIFGDKDRIFPAQAGLDWSRTIPGAVFETVPGGHFVQEDAGAEIVARMLAQARP